MMTELEHEYIKVICEIYPNLATVLGIPKCGYNDFTVIGIKNDISKLEQLLEKVKSQDIETETNMHLMNSLELRIYELTSIVEYRYSAYYYYLMTIKSLLIVLENNDYYDNGINEKIIESRIREFPDVINKAICEMDQKELSKLDLLYTLNLVKHDKILFEKTPNKMTQEDKIKNIHFEIEHFLISLNSKIKDGTEKKIFSSWGPDKLVEYVTKITNWHISYDYIKGLYKEAIDYIEDNVNLNLFEDKKNNNIQIDYSKENLFELLQEIYSNCKSVFGEDAMLLSSIKFMDTKSDKHMFGDFQYIKVSLTNPNANSYLIYSSKNNINSIEQLKLKIIHEIYPGHHYMNRCFGMENKENIYELTRINPYIEEGWAKFCEYFYANEIDLSSNMIECYKKSRLLMSIMFTIAIDIHFNNKKFKEIHTKMIGKCGLTKDCINSMILLLNVKPDKAFSYYIGYNYVTRYVNKNKSDKKLTNILNNMVKDPMSLSY